MIAQKPHAQFLGLKRGTGSTDALPVLLDPAHLGSQEMQALAAVQHHPHIVALHDAWFEPDPRNDAESAYLKLEMCGESLRDVLRRRVQLREAELVEILRQVRGLVDGCMGGYSAVHGAGRGIQRRRGHCRTAKGRRPHGGRGWGGVQGCLLARGRCRLAQGGSHEDSCANSTFACLLHLRWPPRSSACTTRAWCTWM